MGCDNISKSIVALITPFKNNQIDFDELKRICKYHLENQTDGLLLLGTTAEAEALDDKEKKQLVNFVYKIVYPKIELIVGIIDNVTDKVIEQSKLFDGLDIKAFLVINPYYNKTNESGLLKHFTYIADNVVKPIIIYDVPKRTGMKIPFEVIRALSYHQNIIGIKEASSDIIDHLKLSTIANENFKLYGGDDSLMLISLFLNSEGIISVIGNAFAKETSLIIHSFDKNVAISKMMFYKLLPLILQMYGEVSPIGIKYVMYLLGFNTLEYRRPLDEPSRQLKRKLENEVLQLVSQD